MCVLGCTHEQGMGQVQCVVGSTATNPDMGSL